MTRASGVEFVARHQRGFLAAAACLLLVLGLLALHHLTREVRLADVRAAFHAIPLLRLLLAGALTACSYLALTGYDRLALSIIGRSLPWRTAALASFTSYTLSHNLGLAPVTGGSARYRVYTVAGLDGSDVARVVVIAGATFWMGVITVTGLALLLHHGPLAFLPGMAWSAGLAHGVGVAVLAAAVLVLALRPLGITRMGLFGWSVPIPTPRQGLAQAGIAAVDLLCASAALFVLIPDAPAALLPAFMLGYALAIIAVLITHVPGGIGVFEAVVIAAVPAPRTELIAALVAYRVIYYLLPLALGVLLLFWREGVGRRISPLLNGTGAVARVMGPSALAAATFMVGVMLLISGSLPALPGRLYALRALLPLPLVELSHMGASLVGTALLLLAPGLHRRLDGALHAARALLLVGAGCSLGKGLDYEEALVCLALAAMLHRSRPVFFRSTALVARPLSPGWIASAATALAGSLWVGFFAYKHVAYQDALWWHFAFDNNASRFLRTSLAVAVLLVVASIRQLLGPVATTPADAEDTPPSAVLATATRTDAMLALVGDKRFLVSPDGSAFLMYQIRRASWIVMGDPVGPREAWPDLLWRIRALSHAAQGRLLLYQISAPALATAVEMGLHVMKYGEDAVVDLRSFSVAGGTFKRLRQSGHRAAKAGATFEVVPRARVAALLPELALVSDEWLTAKGRREKMFSLGRFDPAYLCQCDCALVRHQGRIVAFANLWQAVAGGELSVDLMRHRSDAPPGTMDYLFVELMQWGREAGFARFSLGLAPLSGIEPRPLSPVWAKVAGFVFRHGERVYGFKGLRAFKQKFAPTWEPRYIAGPSALGTMWALRDLSALIGGTTRARRPRVSENRVGALDLVEGRAALA